MGLSGAMVPAGNSVDVVLEKLRDLVRRQQAGEDVEVAIEAQKDHVRQIVNPCWPPTWPTWARF
jgi:hypothetical protein